MGVHADTLHVICEGRGQSIRHGVYQVLGTVYLRSFGVKTAGRPWVGPPFPFLPPALIVSSRPYVRLGGSTPKTAKGLRPVGQSRHMLTRVPNKRGRGSADKSTLRGFIFIAVIFYSTHIALSACPLHHHMARLFCTCPLLAMMREDGRIL